MKVCPVCNSRCFDDMKVCYGCMHEFADLRPAQTSLTKPLPKVQKKKDSKEAILLPEYFELAESPIIEDKEFFNNLNIGAFGLSDNRDCDEKKSEPLKGKPESFQEKPERIKEKAEQIPENSERIKDKPVEILHNSKDIKIVINIPRGALIAD